MSQVEELTDRRSKLSPAKQALLAKRLGSISGSATAQPFPGFETITPNPGERYEPFPLNELQRAYMLGRSSDFELGNVTTQVYIEIENAFPDLPRLNAAWQRLIERHDMLRAVMISENQQQILEHVPFYEIKTTDLRDRDAETLASELEAIRWSKSHHVPKADEWPLFNLEALLLPDRTRLLFSMDGLIADAISLFLLLSEWTLLYNDLQAVLSPIELSFRDYVLAEIELEQSEAALESLEYWRERLATLPPAPDLPLAKNPLEIVQPRFTRRSLRLGSEAWTKFKANARRAGITSTSALLAAYAEVLTLWSKSQRLTINVPNFNRLPLHPQVNEIVGEFASFTLLEVDHTDVSTTFQDRARRIQEQLWKDMNQYIRGLRVLRELAMVRRDKAAMPVVFTSILGIGLRDQAGAAPASPGDIVYSISQTPQVWLDNQVREEEDELIVEWDAVEELFGKGMLDDLFGAYSRLLQRLAEEEEAWGQRDLELLPASQLQERRAANMTAQAEVGEQVQEAFLAQAAAHPEQVALLSDGQELSYGELARQAAQLAEVLRQHGAGANGLVGILEEKGVGQVVAVLGTLMSGAAYLPLDPENPELRWGRLLEQAQVQLLITERGDDEPWWPTGVQRISLAEVSRGPEPAANWRELGAVGNGEDLAYVMYTSGSTGQPKGVMVNHRGLVNALAWSRAHFGLSRADKAIAITGLHHDMSVFDVLGVLGAGGTLVIPEGWAKLEARRWVELLREHEVTIWNSVPAYMQMLVQYLEQEQEEPGPGSLRLVIMGGDWIGVKLPEQIWRQWPAAQVVSVGGPTETTLWNIYHEVEVAESAARSILYGKPIANNRYYILDELLRERPAGVVGEMYCGGVGVSPGYWQDEERSRERFIRHPESGERLYRTGDLGRYVSGGEIEFIGRADDQVQVGGYRVEPGEVEAVLVQQGGAQAAAVVAVGEERGHKQLVAYVVMGTAAEGEEREAQWSAELQRVVSEWLPGVMTPRRYVYVEELPLTANGKVDRGELGRRALAGRAERGGNEEPSSALEKEVAGIWEEVLGVSGVKLDDNFLELGGHSVLAMQVVTRVRAATGTELSLRQLFEGPTVRELATALEAAQAAAGSGAAATPKIERLERTEAMELPLSFAQQRLWFLDQLEPGNAAYNMPAAARLIGNLNLAALEQSLNEVVRRHEILRTSFIAHDGNPVQVVTPELHIALSPLDLSSLSESMREEEVHQLASSQFQQPFDLTQAPLLRATLLKLSDEEHVILLTVHHIVSDGWSIGILMHELASLYAAFAGGGPSPLPELSIQYGDYAHWQREWLQGEVVLNHLRYWLQQAGSNRPVLELPIDYPRPDIQDYRGSSQSLRLSKSLSDSLKDFSRRESSTLIMTLLAAFNVLLNRWTGQEDIILGLVVANRNHPGIDQLIGCFVNALALRTDLSGNPTFTELLKRVREVALGAYEHQDMPFEKLVEEFQPNRNLNRNPVFDVLFNNVNIPMDTFELPGLTLQPMEEEQHHSKFAMTMYVEEWGEEITLRLVYQSALFAPNRISCLLDQYHHLLEQLVETPELNIHSYSLLTDSTRALLPDPTEVLKTVDYEPVTELFRSWARRTPSSTAISQQDSRWSYAELDHASTAIARLLISKGVKPRDVIGIIGLPSYGLIAGMLGAMLSGGVIMPMDWNLPPQRHQVMWNESKARYLIYVGAQREEDEWLNTISSVIVSVDDSTAQPALESKVEPLPLPDLSADMPAYVFFTSGTTGTPKGVLGWHKGLSQFLVWQRDTFAIGPADRAAQMTGISFDVVLRDIFLPLVSGATLCLPGEPEDVGPERVMDWLREDEITVLHAVPTRAQSWLDGAINQERPAKLRYTFFAGEPLSDVLVQRWRAAFPAGEIVNLYGPTETTLAKFFYREPTSPPPGMQPVGMALPDTQALVLREGRQLCGINDIGEVFLRTPYRSLGYLNAPDENQRRFVPNPFRADDDDILYRTGDGGRYRPDGNLELVGRLDHQIKIQGVRVEPDEIMAILMQHPAMKSCVVMPWKDEQDQSILVAFVVVSKEQRVSTHELRSHVSRQLPAAMVPSIYVFLERLPLTPNGKVDRLALPLPVQPRRESGPGFAAPQTATEEKLAKIWGDVIGVEEIGIHDNFFDLGGHSMLATRVIAQVKEVFQVQLPLCRLFETPTVARMAENIDAARRLDDGL